MIVSFNIHISHAYVTIYILLYTLLTPILVVNITFYEMASVASQLIEKVTAHAQSDSFEDAREICADGIYFPNNLRNILNIRFSV